MSNSLEVSDDLICAIGDCAGNAVRPVSEGSLVELLAATERLEILLDAREMMTSFAG